MPDFIVTSVFELPYLYVERRCGMAPQDISATMSTAFSDVFGFMQEQDIAPAGPAISVYYTYDPDVMAFRAGFMIAQKDAAKAKGDFKADVTPAGKVAHFTHKGSYATLRDSYAAMMPWFAENKLQMSVPCWELYINDPSETPEDDLLTEVYLALA